MKRLPKRSARESDCLQNPRPNPQGKPASESDAPSPHSVHVIEADEKELLFLCEFLSLSGLRVTGSSDPARALEFVERMHPDVLISNLATPQMGGQEILERTRKVSPETGVILVSDWPDHPIVEHAGSDSEIDLLIGPFAAGGLLHAVERMLGTGAQGDLVE